MENDLQRHYHQAHFTKDPARAIVWQAISEYVSSFIQATDHVLELGSGYCYWINNTSAQRRVCIDIWEEMPKFAEPGIEAIVHDLRHGLSVLGDSQFNVVLASNVLEHFTMEEAYFIAQEVFKYLHIGGFWILIQPNFHYAWRNYFDDYTHRAVFSHVSLCSLLRASGFEIVKLEKRFTPYSMRDSRLPIRKWIVAGYLRLPFRPFAGQMLVVARRPF